MKNIHRFALIGSLALSTPASFGAVSFDFTYADSTWSPEAKASLNDAANTLASYFTAYTAVVTMNVTGSNVMGSTLLASAGSNYTNLSAGFGNLGIVGTKILSNGANDQNGSGAGNEDGSVDANFAQPWAFGDTVGSGEFDFKSTMIHELSHALGFAGLIEEDGSSAFGSSFYSPWDGFLANGDGTKMVNPGTFDVNGAWATDSLGGTGTNPASANTGLYFDGMNAVAANGGQPIPIYSPGTWEGGSSASHLDTDFYTGMNTKLMNHATPDGPGDRTVSPIEVGMFKDLGYTAISDMPVPEPSSALFSLIGFSFLLRRKR